MQDPAATFQQIKPQFPEHEQLKCPRCESSNTKFCYYNNYNLSQPRHFCKNCRRYWTKGGTLRNIPVGGGSRKNSKRSSGNSSKRQANSKTDPEPEGTRIRVSADSSPSSRQSEEPALVSGMKDPTRILMGDQDRKMLDFGGSFSSLLATNGQLGNLLEGLSPDGSGLKRTQMGGFGGEMESGQDPDGEPGIEERNYLGGGDSSCWSGSGNGWPDLAIYTPGSSFQ